MFGAAAVPAAGAAGGSPNGKNSALQKEHFTFGCSFPLGTQNVNFLPQAVQVIGPRYREDLCLDAAAAIEDRLGILTPIDPR